MGGDEFSEPLFVLFGRDDGGPLVLGDHEGGFDPILELLVPRVLSEIVDYAAHEFSPVTVHSH